MKKTANNRISIATLFVLAIIAALFGFVGLTVRPARAASTTYYICYAADDYRVYPAKNAMTESGGVYTISPTLTQGDKFLVSDGNGALFGNDKGEPVTIRESGTQRYTVTFDGATVSYTEYSPEAVSIEISGATVLTADMQYRRANAVFDEFVYTAYDLKAGDSVEISVAGVKYGVDGAATDAFIIPKDGDYRFTFTKDEDHLYDDKYIKAYDVPELYVLCDGNGFATDPSYRMERDEDIIAYEEYYYEKLSVVKKDGELKFRIYDATNDEEYLPSSSGKLDDLDKGDYRIIYSPDHAYRVSGDNRYYASARRAEEYYGGYYVLGDFNDYEFTESDDFDSEYKLEKNANRDYDEYELTLYITQEKLDDFDGKIEFYVTDGTSIYRKPTGADISIDRAGEYELYFSPEHNYGRGYRYRYERVSDEPTRETVYITTTAEYNAFAAKCVSPEFTLNKTVILKNGLDFTDQDITPMAIFAGELDGLYNTIEGIEIDGGDNSAYIIGRLTADGIVKRLGLSVAMSGGDNVAPIAHAYGTAGEVTVSGTVDGDSYVGGLVGSLYAGGEIESCVSTAVVNGLLNVGGIAGFNAGEIRDSENSGAVNNKAFTSGDARAMLNVGGICGYATGNIFGCNNSGNIGFDQSRYFGGIVGLSSGGIYFCENKGSVGAENYAGGIVGYYGRFGNNNDQIVGSDISSWLDEYFGTGDGNFEEAEDTLVREIYYCFNSGAVTAENRAGGIAGKADATGLDIVGCVSSGNITAGSSYAGGIAGELGASTVSECVGCGRVVSQKESYAGGIAGASTGVIEYSASSAYVEAETSFAGGIVGSGATVRNCVSHAYVKKPSGECFGMIAGQATIYRNNFYPSGIYSDSSSEVKGIDGVNYGSENNYGACELDMSKIVSQGMLSPELYGLDTEHWLAGESEARFPVPRCFTDIVSPEQYTESARFEKAFNACEGLKEAAENVGKVSVTVAFFEYDFDNEKYELLEMFYISSGSGVNPPEVPQEDGYFTWWDTTDFSSFDKNTDVKMMFDKYITSVASDDTAHPLVIATGKFYSDTELKLNRNGEYISLSFERSGAPVSYGTVGVRYFVGNNGKVVVKLIDGGEITDAKFTVDGGYAIFELADGAAFCVSTVAGGGKLALIVSLSVVGTAIVVALCFCVPLLAKRRKRKKSESEKVEAVESENIEATEAKTEQKTEDNIKDKSEDKNE